VDLVVLDLMLPLMSGYEICRTLRRLDTEIPVLALTARTLSEDKIQAFDCGVDQYMTKPFSLPELLSRVRNLLDRVAAILNAGRFGRQNDVVRFGDVIADFGRFEIRHKDEVHTMTTREQELLRYFLENDGVVLSRARIAVGCLEGLGRYLQPFRRQFCDAFAANDRERSLFTSSFVLDSRNRLSLCSRARLRRRRSGGQFDGRIVRAFVVLASASIPWPNQSADVGRTERQRVPASVRPTCC
jgi:hypothetical protein